MLKKIINKALELGFADAEIVEKTSGEVEITLFKGVVDKNFIGNNKTYTLKGILNGKMASISFQKDDKDFTDQEIDELVNRLMENAKSITSKEQSSIFAGSESYPQVEKVDSGLDKVTAEDKINLLKQIEKEALASSDKVKLLNYCSYMEEYQSVKMFNSKGLNLSKENQYCGVVLGVVAGEKESNDNQNGFEVNIKKRYCELDPHEIVKKATEQAINMIGAKPVESKDYPVIINNETMTSILQGFFSIFSAEALLRRLTALADKLGTKIMSDKITIIDDPLNKDAIKQDPFDAEGVATYTKEVVSKGVFKTFLHNIKTATTLNTVSTGNATSNGIMGMNFHIQNGDSSFDELLEGIEEGLIITDLAGLHAALNPISGDFSGQASGYLIKNGKKDRPVSLIVLSGNFLKMMNDIEKVGNDLRLDYSGFGSPSILFKSLPISGK